ncbi:MAG: hypothetical protein C4321_00520, partial [Chloroflexota bacterium]
MSTLGPHNVHAWAELGRRLYKGNWKSSSLAAQFYEVTPELFRVLRIGQASRLVIFIDELARHSYELASACLANAPEVLARLEDEDRLPFITFATELAQTSWADSRLYFDRGVALLEKIHAPLRERFLLLAAQAARGHHQRSAFQYLEDAANALGELEPTDHQPVIMLAEQLAPYSPFAALDFITSMPTVLQRIRVDELEAWQQAGLRILQTSAEGGEAYFRLQSTRAEDILENLSSRVELSRIGEVLRLYCKALTGRNISIQTAESLAEKGIGWVDEHRASTDGSTIFLPELMERFPNKEDNFAAMKVFATHQAAHIEFGSFTFDFDRPGAIFPTRRHAFLRDRERSATTDMEAYFDLFPDRQLASDLFTIAEDARIDARVKDEYGGIRRQLVRMQAEELERRPAVELMPLRNAFIENLVRASLDGIHLVRWPRDRSEAMSRALGILAAVQQPGATVEDAAEAA